jgi:magnesium transporter
MVINGYRIIDDSHKALEPCEDFLEPWKRGEGGSYWVDVHSYGADELEVWLGNLHVSPLAIERCLEAGHATWIFPLNEHEEAFFKFPIYSTDGASELLHLSFLCIPNLVVTLHSGPLASLEHTIKELTVEMTLSQPTISALVNLLFFLESTKSLRISEALKKAVFDLDEGMDDNPDSVNANEIRAQKRSLRTLDTVVGAQISCFEYVGSMNRPFLDLMALTKRFQLVTSNASAANQIVDRLEKTISDIHQRFETNQQEKTNRRLAVLTVLSAIFMPLTFIAGIYGMNFNTMPELQHAFGYPAVLIFMALVAGGMYLYFKKRGWLD